MGEEGCGPKALGCVMGPRVEGGVLRRTITRGCVP